jgi:hypothetical protein
VLALGGWGSLDGMARQPDSRGTAWGAVAAALLVSHLLAYWGLIRYTGIDSGRTAGDPATPLTEPLIHAGVALMLTLSTDAWLVTRDARELRRGIPGASTPAVLLRLAGRGWVAWETAWLLTYAGTLIALCHQGSGPGYLPVLAVAVPALPVLVRLLAAATVRRRSGGPPVDALRVRQLARWLVSGTFRASSPVLYLVLLTGPTKSSPWDDLLLALLGIRLAWAVAAAAIGYTSATRRC